MEKKIRIQQERLEKDIEKMDIRINFQKDRIHKFAKDFAEKDTENLTPQDTQEFAHRIKREQEKLEQLEQEKEALWVALDNVCAMYKLI